MADSSMCAVRPPGIVTPLCGAKGHVGVPQGVPVIVRPRRITSWVAGASISMDVAPPLLIVALAPVASMVIALPMVTGPKDPLSRTLIWPPVAVFT